MKNRRLSSRIIKSTNEFTQSRFRGVAYRREILDNSPKGGGGYGRLHARSLILISSSTHSYRPTIVSWADITVSLLVRRAYAAVAAAMWSG